MAGTESFHLGIWFTHVNSKKPITVTSMMFRDIQLENTPYLLLPRGTRTPSLLYADDTLLIATRPHRPYQTPTHSGTSQPKS